MSGTLRTHLLAALAAMPSAPLCVAFSGGPDSTALLHALSGLPLARARGLRALHVDHGLHADSSRWARHCQALCGSLDVPCEVLPVNVQRGSGMGLEAAAREVRHAALAAQLHEDELLLFAHHRDDQVETVLLKLLRGAGPDGLGGMRVLRPFGRGQLWRPLLALSRRQLLDYVAEYRLDCIDDPSNADTRLARNRLRHEVLPQLMRYWPQAADSILHSAALSRAAADTLRTQWLGAFDDLHDAATGSLSASSWLALAPALREPLLDHWLHARGRSAPTTAQRQQIERQCIARAGRLPCVRWDDTELHIWKERMWALPAGREIDEGWHADWQGEPLTLPDGGELSLSDPAARFAQPLRVHLRRGGERIKPDGDAHTRELRDLFQQAQLPPWQRQACPLIHAGNELVAVADRWQSARGAEIFRETGALPRWRPGRGQTAVFGHKRGT